MINRLLLSIVVGIVVAIVVWLIGLALTLMPVVAPLGAALEMFAPAIGLLMAIWFYLTGRTSI